MAATLATATATELAQFDAILNIEDTLQRDRAIAAMGEGIETRVAADKRSKATQQRLYRAIDALGLDNMPAYGEYRRAAELARKITRAMND